MRGRVSKQRSWSATALLEAGDREVDDHVEKKAMHRKEDSTSTKNM